MNNGVLCVGPIVTALLFIGLTALLINHLQTIFTAYRSLAVLLYKLKVFRKTQVISAQITSSLNKGIILLKDESPGIFEHSLRIELVQDPKQLAKLEDGEIIVYLQDSLDQDRILADSTMVYLKKAVIADARPYIDNRLLEAFDVTLAERILAGIPTAYNYMLETYRNQLQADSRTAEYYQLADDLDSQGALTRVVLREFSNLGSKLRGKKSTRRVREETINFARFVSRIVDGDKEMPLRFLGQIFKITVALIARPEQLQKSGLNLYQQKFRDDIEYGTRTIYLLARGRHNVNMTKFLARWAVEQGLVSQILSSDFYLSTSRGERVITSCIACFSSKADATIQFSPIEELLSAIATVIPETLTGRVDIVSAERVRGIKAKIIVHSSNEAENPLAYCIGPNEENLKKIKSILKSSEEIEFIKWIENSRERILAALCIPSTDVLKIELKEEQAEAKVIVRSQGLIGTTLGVKGVNVQLAERLTGYKILVDAYDGPTMSSEELDVLSLISSVVEPIASGTVQIEKIARLAGESTKVMVSSARTSNPTQLCIPFVPTLRESLREYIHFIDKLDNQEKQIIQALYPLNRQEVHTIVIDQKTNTATVEVTSYQAYGAAIGKNGTNVKLAEKLLGYKRLIIQIEEGEKPPS